MSYKLRPYQEEGVQASLEYIRGKGKKFGVVVAPTGAGKSFYIAELARRLHEPVLVLQPNKELLEQNYSKYVMYGHKASIYSASMNSREIGEEVTFGTIKTIISDVESFILAGIKVVIIDECHLASKNSSQAMDFINRLNIEKVIGLTATPLQLKNSRELGAYLQIITTSRENMFRDIVHVTQIEDIIKQGFWADIIYEKNEVDNSMLELNTTGTDYTGESLVWHYLSNQLNAKIIREVTRLRNEGRKSILIFMSSIDESRAIASELRSHNINSQAIYSGMSKRDRQRIVNDFKNLSLPVVVNVNILSVGFDHPELDAIIMARPTNSFAIYYQQVGRGVRPHPNKKDVKICDYSGNIDAFGELEGIRFLSHRGRMQMISGNDILTGIHKGVYVVDPQSKKLWFGIHKGKRLADVPMGYLKWIYANFDFKKIPQFKNDIENEVLKRGGTLPERKVLT